MQSQYIHRVCDNPKCNSEIEIPMQGAIHPQLESEISGWVSLGKEHFLRSGEPPQTLVKHGCCATCAVEIIRNGVLELPVSAPGAN